jgi:site-specific DNA-cytosine methylase
VALRALSLCSGAGALDLGLRWVADIRTVAYVERDAFAAAPCQPASTAGRRKGTGNGVVPQCAAVAFRALLERARG